VCLYWRALEPENNFFFSRLQRVNVANIQDWASACFQNEWLLFFCSLKRVISSFDLFLLIIAHSLFSKGQLSDCSYRCSFQKSNHSFEKSNRSFLMSNWANTLSSLILKGQSLSHSFEKSDEWPSHWAT